MKPRVAVLTTFTGSDEAYSLVNVVRTHLEMMLAAGYDPTLLVASTWRTSEDFWSGRMFRVVPTAHPDARAEDIALALGPILLDYNVVLCHDILFLSQHEQWAQAVRALAKELDKVAWVHFQHSRGDGQKGDSAPPRSWWAYPNQGDLDHVAHFNQADLNRVAFVPHVVDYKYFDWPHLAVQIAEETGFFSADVSMLYPTRLDSGKQVDKLVRLAAGIKRAGKSVRLLVADAYATGERFQSEEGRLKKLAKAQGLSGDELVFLSERYEDCRYSTPRKVVKALFEMSNLFALPSNSETFSLIAQEAAMTGNLLVLNADFPPILPLYEKALTLPFGSVLHPDVQYFRHVKTADGKETKVLDDQLFWDDQARLVVLPAMESQLNLQLRKQILRERWPSRVWAEHLEPLILRAWEEVQA